MINKQGMSSVIAIILALTVPTTAMANRCAIPSQDGDVTLGNGVVNNYWSGTNATLNTGSNTVTIGAARNLAGPAISVGDLLLIVQVQGVTINATNTANYGDNDGVAPRSLQEALRLLSQLKLTAAMVEPILAAAQLTARAAEAAEVVLPQTFQ